MFSKNKCKHSFTIHSVKFNAVMNIALTASNTLVALITVPYATRVLSVSGYGDVGFAQSVSSWFSVFCIMGISVYGVRECARVRDNPVRLAITVKELLCILTVTTVASLIVYAACILLVPAFRADATLLWIFFVNALLVSYGVEWFFQAIEQYIYITIRSLVFKIISLLGILCLVRHQDDFILYGALLALVPCGNNILNIIQMFRIVDFRLTGPISIKRHIRPLFSFAMLNISTSLYGVMDSMILGLMTLGNYQVGLYQLGVRIRGAIASVVNATASATIPRLSYYNTSEDKAKYYALLRRGLGLIVSLGLAQACYLMVFGDEVVMLVASAKFSQAALPLRIMGFATFFSVINSAIGYQVLTPNNRERQLAIANAIGVPIGLTLNIVLDGRFGAIGASIAITLTEGAIMIAQIHFARDVLNRAMPVKTLVKITTAIFVATIVSMLTKAMFSHADYFIQLAISCVSFFGVWITVVVLLKEETMLSLLTSIIRRIRK